MNKVLLDLSGKESIIYEEIAKALDPYKDNQLFSNVILVPSEEAKNIKNLFNEYRIKYKLFESWVRI